MIRIVAFAISLLTLTVGSAVAATCTTSATFTVNPAVGSGCYAIPLTTPDNINGSSNDGFLDQFTASGFVAIADTDDSSVGVGSGAWVTTPIKGTNSGTFQISSAVGAEYTTLVLALKAGNGWAAFLLPDDILSGTWSSSKGLSHANLYGVLSAVPLPPSLPTFAAGLALLGFLGWRKMNGVV
jgi:hypothetical protein